MDSLGLKKFVDVAAGRRPADLVLRGARIADVMAGGFVEGSLAIVDGLIAGIGNYEGESLVNLDGGFLLPGLIDSHIHIESSFLRPREFGRMLVPHGVTTAIVDPHEIVNVCGIAGLDFMIQDAADTALDIKFMLPSCVPATPFEQSGFALSAAETETLLENPNIFGLGEFMDFLGLANGSEEALGKILAARNRGLVIDGHSPGLTDAALAAYAGSGIYTDHECATLEEMRERLSCGIYVQLRQGSACRDLAVLLPGVTAENERRCLFCSDDRDPVTLLEKGALDEHLRIAAEAGIPPITAIRMAALNAAECYALRDRGALTPGRRADIIWVDGLKDYRVRHVWIKGVCAAEDGVYCAVHNNALHDNKDVEKEKLVRGSFHVRDWSPEKLRLKLKNGDVWVIDISPEKIITGKGRARVKIDKDGFYQHDGASGIAKIAVIERHRATGNAGLALIRGYGIKHGAIAISIAHDSHNIIVCGVNDDDMYLATSALIEIGGGIVLAQDGRLIAKMPLPLAGLMSDLSGIEAADSLREIHRAARSLGVDERINPVLTLSFMSLPVIPELKITAGGLFDTAQNRFIPLEAE